LPDTVRTIDELLTRHFRDNQPAGSITPQHLRDLAATLRDRTGGADMVAVTEFGARADGSTDCAPAFARALAAIGKNGVVMVPQGPKPYRLGAGVTVTNRALLGVGQPQLLFDPTAPDSDGIVLNNPFNANLDRGSTLANLILLGQGKGRDLVRVVCGNFVRIRNLLLDQAGRDGLHVEGDADHHWTEDLSCVDVKVTGARRDAFHFRVPPGLRNVFINQTAMVNCESRYPARHALALVNDSDIGGGDAKISAFTWLNGELEATGPNAADIVLLRSSGVGQVESLSFYDVAIEDTTARRKGYAIKVERDGSGAIGPLNIHNSIFYGAAAGAISDLAQLSGYDIDFLANGEPRSSRLVSRLCSAFGETKMLATGGSEAVYKLAGKAVVKLFVTATGDDPSYHLEATVFNGTHLATIVASKITASLGDGMIVLHNGGAAQGLSWYVQNLR
jgi:hypothetical protein